MSFEDKNKWALKSIDETLSTLRTRKLGLSEDEAIERLGRIGENKIESETKFKHLKKFLSQLKDPVVNILLIAGILTYLIDEKLDSYIIFATLFINLIINIAQDRKVSNAFKLLARAYKSNALVLRNSTWIEIPVIKLVPGDIVSIRSGSKIPADIRLTKESSLRVDESILTGEWAPVQKSTLQIASDRPINEQFNMLWKGTTVLNGLGEGVVVETGKNTIVGKIAKRLDEKEALTPLQQQISVLAKFIMVLVLLVVMLIFIVGVYKNIPFSEIIITSIAVAIAGVPSGLPAAITLVLALGTQSILKKGGLVRNLVASETLGSTTWILTDKTGTLTEGNMKIGELITFSGRESVDHLTDSGKAILRYIFLGTAGIKSKSEDGFVYLGSEVEKEFVKKYEEVFQVTPDRESRVCYLSFDSKNKYSAALIQENSNDLKYVMVGAPETILSLVKNIKTEFGINPASIKEREHLNSILKEETSKGRRVLAVAISNNPNLMGHEEEDLKFGEVSSSVLDAKNQEITFLSFISLEDPIRESVPESIKFIQDANVNISVVTGDNQFTAIEIAKESGIILPGESEEFVLGTNLKDFNDEELFAKAKVIKVFARMLPDQKLRLLRVLMERGEIVAMTGDGVNDAPALHRASIGVAVASGTDVAREASDLVLLDNSFTTITAAIIEGRKIISNLKKVSIYLLSTSFSEATLIAGGLMLSGVLPITPIQVLWANIVEEAFVGFSFAFEKEDPDTAKKNPRDKSMRSIISENVKDTIVILVIVIGIFLVSLYSFLYFLTDLTTEQIQTVMFLAVSLDSIFLALSLKRLNRSIFKSNLLDNKWLLISIFFSLSLLVLAFILPPLREILSIVDIPLIAYFVIPIVAVFHVLAIETIKKIFFRSEYPENL